MHLDNINELSLNVVNILKGKMKTIEKLQKSKVYTSDDGEAVTQLEDRKNAIINEFQKVENLEMTLAVVGTMKSGKSTTINAIVGHDILPNRSRPMTTLPTLIRHKKGQKEPVLLFDNSRPTSDLLKKITTTLQQDEFRNFKGKNQETDQLAHNLQEGIKPRLCKRYEGQDAIFKFLTVLNDIFRLAGELNITPPYKKYEKLVELPVIEVEFYHLSKQAEQAGTLSILDTPGPNEFGQSRELKRVFKTQLQQASAVMLVMDYTQLGSESEVEVREEVQQIRNELDNRLHVLVNKFDNANRNSMGFEDTKIYVAERMLGDGFNKDNVYPVSSNWAFLSNYVMRSLEGGDKLDIENLIIQDFAEECLGRRWESKIEDEDEVRHGTEELWIDSGFESPLKHIIEESHQNAALATLTAALDRLISYSEELSSLLKAREVSIDKDAKELKKIIDGLSSDIENVEALKLEIDKTINITINDFSNEIKVIQNDKTKHLRANISTLFNEGKAAEKIRKEAEEAKRQRENQTFLFGITSKSLKADKRKQVITALDFDPNDPVVEFSSEGEAKQYVRKIQKRILKPFNQYQDDIDQIVSKMPKVIAISVEGKLENLCGKIIDQAQEQLKDEGLEFNFSFPKANFDNLQVSYENLFGESIEEDTKQVSRSRKKSGAWNWFKGWFGAEEYETYYVSEDVYSVDMSKVKKQVQAETKRIQQSTLSIQNSYVADIVRPQLLEQVKKITDYFERFRGELLKGINDQKKSQIEQDELKSELKNFESLLQTHKLDAQDAYEELSEA